MVGWHHRLNAHEFEQAPGVGDGQGGLACCRPWGRRESETTERLNWIDGCFTLLSWFLLYSQVNRSCVCVCVYVCVCVCIHIYTCMHICPPFWISFPFRSPQNQLEFPVALKTINWITFLSFRCLWVDSGNDSSHHLEESTDPHMQCLLSSSLLNELIYKIP